MLILYRNGDWSADFITERMAWAAIKGMILKPSLDNKYIKIICSKATFIYFKFVYL